MRNKQSSTCHSATTKNKAETTPTTTILTNNHVFENYEKPILLVGAKEIDVMSKLGHQLASELQTNVVVDTEDEEEGKAFDIQLLTISPEAADPSSLLSSYYNKGYCMIYINVQGMIPSKLEDDVIVPYTDYELCIKPANDDDDDDDDDDHLVWELQRLISRAVLVPPASVEEARLTMGEQTFFCSLTFPNVEQSQEYVKEICQDVDAMEYRVDLLLDSKKESRFEILYGMQQLRCYCRPYAQRVGALPTLTTSGLLEDVFPIVYTVRTANQAGTYPDDTPEDIQNMFRLLKWGLRGGLEVLDVESAWDATLTDDLLQYAQERHSSTLILGSHHVVGQEKAADLEEAVGLFQQCQLQGRAHATKVVLSTNDSDDDSVAFQAGLIAQSLLQQEEGEEEEDGKKKKKKKEEEVLPSISLMLGEVAQFSRVLNKPFTPVTHESLPFVAAPGQMTASELMATRILTKLLPSPKYYCILGHNISYSVSPQMHNAAFCTVRLPYQYVVADVATVEEFVEDKFFKSDQFAGCSVTIPHKQSIMKHCDVLSDAAQAIGSVNTLIVTEEIDEEEDVMKRVIVGDNTDWKGMYNPLQRRLRGNTGPALILGAGGTARAAAYTAQQLGLSPIYYYNRTPEKAQELVDEFGGELLSDLQELKDKKEDKPLLSVIISTLPQSVGFTLPDFILSQQQQQQVVLLDVNYKPYTTDLIAQVEQECPNWNIIRGSEMLWEQGVGQFELWTKRRAPYGVMKKAVLDNCLPKEEEEEEVQDDVVVVVEEEENETNNDEN
eukprot:CAMPEP_0178903144 /NCGR_PEP_ID=MMETSP0786-20121207/4995_1 /TAXON_ID=186022 /ORGANISM="Thalassionema frauenfeldii, Strain CCMP 1798" /LENGTH=779 /DNA_ID=CAMNT_0020574485 /DNA_START=87 /DNA_END=2426 /DNA_ORIENTATION=+